MRTASRQPIRVHIKLVGFLALLAGRPEMDVNVEMGSTVADSIQVLAKGLGVDFRKAILDSQGNLHGEVTIMLNHQHIPPQNIHESVILEDSHLVVIPLVNGG